MASPRFLPLAAAGVVYLAFRALVLHTSFDAVSLPNYELTVSGNLAHIALEGWRGAPVHQYYDNCGGHLVTGILAIPPFALLGHSYLALKLVPVLLGLGTLALIWAVLARWFDPRAAAIAALCFALGPPTLTKYSMLAKGNHFENLFFQLACVWIFLRLHTSERKTPWVLAFGLAAGFAIFFYFGSMAIVALLALTHLAIRGARAGLRDFAIAIPSFAAGLAPLAWVHWHAHDRPGQFLEAKLAEGEGGAAAFFGRIGRFLTDILPRAGVFEDLGPIPARVAELAFLAAFVVAWATLAAWIVRRLAGLRAAGAATPAERERARFEALRALPLVLYLPVVTLIVGTSTFEFKPYGPPVEVGQFRYLVPHFTFATMTIGIAVALLTRARAMPARVLGAGVGAAALATGLFTLPIVDWRFERTGLGRAYDGHLLRYYNNVVLRDSRVDETTGRLTWDHERVARQLADFDAIESHEVWLGVGYHLAAAQTMERRSARTPPRLDLDALCAPYPAAHHTDLARGAGSWLRFLASLGEKERAVVAAATAELAASDHPLASWVVAGMCTTFDYPLARLTAPRLARSAALEPLVPEPLRPAWRRGQGIECGTLLARGIPSDVALVRAAAGAVPDPARADFWHGVGIGLARDGAARALPAALAAEVPREHRTAALAGFGAGMRQGLGADACAPLFRAWQGELAEAERAALELGLRWPSYPRPLTL